MQDNSVVYATEGTPTRQSKEDFIHQLLTQGKESLMELSRFSANPPADENNQQLRMATGNAFQKHPMYNTIVSGGVSTPDTTVGPSTPSRSRPVGPSPPPSGPSSPAGSPGMTRNSPGRNGRGGGEVPVIHSYGVTQVDDFQSHGTPPAAHNTNTATSTPATIDMLPPGTYSQYVTDSGASGNEWSSSQPPSSSNPPSAWSSQSVTPVNTGPPPLHTTSKPPRTAPGVQGRGGDKPKVRRDRSRERTKDKGRGRQQQQLVDSLSKPIMRPGAVRSKSATRSRSRERTEGNAWWDRLYPKEEFAEAQERAVQRKQQQQHQQQRSTSRQRQRPVSATDEFPTNTNEGMPVAAKPRRSYSINSMSEAKGDNVWNHLYQSGMYAKERKQQLAAQEEARRLMEENYEIERNCTFKPNIEPLPPPTGVTPERQQPSRNSNYSGGEGVDGDGGESSDSHQHNYHHHQHQQQQQQHPQQQHPQQHPQQQHLQQEQQIHPLPNYPNYNNDIDYYDEEGDDPANDVYRRLVHDSQRKEKTKRKLQKEAEDNLSNQCTFHPQTNANYDEINIHATAQNSCHYVSRSPESVANRLYRDAALREKRKQKYIKQHLKAEEEDIQQAREQLHDHINQGIQVHTRANLVGRGVVAVGSNRHNGYSPPPSPSPPPLTAAQYIHHHQQIHHTPQSHHTAVGSRITYKPVEINPGVVAYGYPATAHQWYTVDEESAIY